MKRATSLLSTMMLCAAPWVMAQSGRDGSVALNAAQMDNVTAGQVAGPLATAAAVASATGQLAFYSTSVNTYVTGSPSAPLSGMPGSYTTASGATALAVAHGQGGQASTDTALMNEQPLPPEAVQSTTINFTANILGTSISVQSEVDFGGYNIYRVNQAMARMGN
jgi:hypothetical protein